MSISQITIIVVCVWGEEMSLDRHNYVISLRIQYHGPNVYLEKII